MTKLLSLLLSCLLLLTALPFAVAQQSKSTFAPSSLRCEYLVSPLAIDVREPRLSWTIESDVRGTKQSAYQVLVAGSEVDLLANRGDLWDTGRVASNRTIQIDYRGKSLRSRQECFWKVRVWDQNGRPSTWSKPARWQMGLTDPSDWSAQWIGDRLPFYSVPSRRPDIHRLRPGVRNLVR